MRILSVVFCLLIATFVQAAEWRNDLFGVAVNLPDTDGWQPIDAPSTPALTVLVAMQNPQKQTVFGVNILHQLPSANLRDPATIAAVEQSLRGLGYQFFGRATVNVGGREWVQFPVRGGNPPTSGLIRYTSANNQIYVVSLLKGGGQEAAQDPELQAAAASVRITQPVAPAVAATQPAPGSSSTAPAIPGASLIPGAPAPTTPAAPSTAAEEEKKADGSVKIGSITITKQQLRLGLYAVGGLIVLIILLKIIGSGSNQQPPKRRY